MSTDVLQEWSKKAIKEIVKHAEVDHCKTCQELLELLTIASGVKAKDLTQEYAR